MMMRNLERLAQINRAPPHAATSANEPLQVPVQAITVKPSPHPTG